MHIGIVDKNPIKRRTHLGHICNRRSSRYLAVTYGIYRAHDREGKQFANQTAYLSKRIASANESGKITENFDEWHASNCERFTVLTGLHAKLGNRVVDIHRDSNTREFQQSSGQPERDSWFTSLRETFMVHILCQHISLLKMDHINSIQRRQKQIHP